jgi:hypothetical protein
MYRENSENQTEFFALNRKFLGMGIAGPIQKVKVIGAGGVTVVENGVCVGG